MTQLERLEELHRTRDELVRAEDWLACWLALGLGLLLSAACCLATVTKPAGMEEHDNRTRQ